MLYKRKVKRNEGCVSMTHSFSPGVNIKFSIRSVPKSVVNSLKNKGWFSTLEIMLRVACSSNIISYGCLRLSSISINMRQGCVRTCSQWQIEFAAMK